MVFKGIVGPESQKANRQVSIDVGNETAQGFDFFLVDFGNDQDSILPELVSGITADEPGIAQ